MRQKARLFMMRTPLVATCGRGVVGVGDITRLGAARHQGTRADTNGTAHPMPNGLGDRGLRIAE
jgi:hypothetical protein